MTSVEKEQTGVAPVPPSSPIPLAIIGIGCVFPKANNLQEYWTVIKNRIDCITEVPETHWRIADYFDDDPAAPDRVYARKGGFLSPVDFDPTRFAIIPNNLEAIDTSQLLGLVVATRALNDAGYLEKREFDRKRTSVVLGVTGAQELVIPLGARLGHPIWRRALNQAGIDDATAQRVVQAISDSYVGWQESSFPGLLGNVVSGRISNHLDLGGTNCVIDTACGSSLSALHLAGLELSAGHCDMALTGGIDTFNDIFMYMCFCKTPALSPTGHARPFDHHTDGTTLGEGLGIVVLKRLDDAQRDGDRIYAVVRSLGTSSDGKGENVFAPNPAGQTRALRNAYQLAGVDPRTIELVEAHGTGTKVGDVSELTALHEVYPPADDTQAWCALGSVKSQIGHTKAAAGIAGLIKAVLALHHKVLPPTIKVDHPAESLTSNKTPFYLNTEKRPWMPRRAHPRRAAVSSFGFGGTNFHCLLEEYRHEKTTIDWDSTVQIIAWSAESREKLRDTLNQWPRTLSWNELCERAQTSRATFRQDQPCRLVIALEKDRSDPSKVLARAERMLAKHAEKDSWSTPDGAYFGFGATRNELGILFPGQGSQYLGMFRDLACQFPQMFDVLAEANTCFQINKTAGIDRRLIDFIYPEPAFDDAKRASNEAALRDTRVAQPALGAVSLGAFRVLQYFGVKPQAIGGHSYGELTSLCAAGRIRPEELHRLSALRGQLMTGRNGELGTMLAVQAGQDTVEKILESHHLELVVANHNAPAQIVLSGTTAEIERATEIVSARDIRHKRLPVSAAFHSPLVSDAQVPFASALEEIEFSKASTPVFSNTTGGEYPTEPADARSLLAHHLARPVRFVDEIRNMHAHGVRTFLEVGPETVLTGLVRAIFGESGEVGTMALDLSRGHGNSSTDLAKTLAHLAALGFSVELPLWNPPMEEEGERTRTAKSKMKVPICGANYVRPATMKQKSTPITSPPDATPLPARVGEVTSSPSESSQTPSTGGSVNVTSPAGQPELLDALRITQQNMEALQRIQEQTARLHRQFLENQESGLKVFQALSEQQQQLLQTALAFPSQTTGIPPSSLERRPTTTVPSSQPVAVTPETAVTKPEPDIPDALPLGVDLEQVSKVLFDAVSEKTGYPVEMFELDMNLDSDLGIDSIKRVEIFSLLKEQLPAAGAIKSEHIGMLKTLRHIAEFIVSAHPDGRKEQPAKAAGASPPAPIPKPGPEIATDRPNVEFGSVPSEPRTLRKMTVRAVSLERLVLSEHPLHEHKKRGPIAVLPGSDILISDDKTELATAIEKQLRALDYSASLISLDKVSELKVPARLGGLVILAPPGALKDTFVTDAFRLLQRTGSALREAGNNGGALFATVSRLDGAFGLRGLKPPVEPLSGGLAGLVKTARYEWSEVHCKALDLALDFSSPDDAALQVVDEIFLRDPVEVGLSMQGRCTTALSPRPLNGSEIHDPFCQGDVVVITGGARGITAECAVRIAQGHPGLVKPVLVLLGRSPEPYPEPEWLVPLREEREIQRELIRRARQKISPQSVRKQVSELMANREILRTLTRIESAGAQVWYRSVDVRNLEALQAVIDEIRANVGPIKGLIHGAGVTADRRIEEKTEEEFERVYATKVVGLRHLLQVLRPDALKNVVLFSSASGRYGRAGQVDYAVANEVLNKMAVHQAQLHPSCHVVAINWGPWDGGMVTAPLKGLFLEEGVGLIPLKEGAEALMQEIYSVPDHPAEVLIKATSPREAKATTDAASATLSVAFEREMSLESYPIIRSHVIGGRAVLPLSLIIECLAHGAMVPNPGLVFCGFDDLQVLKGVKLEEREFLVLRVMTGKARRQNNEYVVPVELTSSADREAYELNARADVVLSTKPPSGKRVLSDIAPQSYPHSLEEIYRDFLFHGADLQGIERIEGCSEQGIGGTVKTAPKPSTWIQQPFRHRWITDPLALDCGFQMTVLWIFEKYGAGSLPTYAGRYRQFVNFPRTRVHITVQVTSDSDSRALADIEITDEEGIPVAHLKDLEYVIDSSLNEAFADNQIDVNPRVAR